MAAIQKTCPNILLTGLKSNGGCVAETIRIYNPQTPVKFICEDPYIWKQIDEVNALDASTPILITGETGTGKGELAKFLMSLSKRVGKKEVFTIAEYADQVLLQGDLFGKSNTFTDVESQMGWFEYCDKGILCLDEIGNLNMNCQTLLLSILERNQVVRLGSTQAIDVNVQVILMTNKPLDQLVEQGLFRDDLYHRISNRQIELKPKPPKSNLKSITDQLIQHLLYTFNKDYVDIETSIYQTILTYHWPGNIRQLKSVLSNCIQLATDHIISNQLLSSKIITKKSFSPFYEFNCQISLKENVSELKKSMIHYLMTIYNNDLNRISDQLNISKRNLYYLIEQYKLTPL